MTPEIRNLAANAVREIKRNYPPELSLNLKALAAKLGGEPLWDPVGYFARGDRAFRDSALFSCQVIADMQ